MKRIPTDVWMPDTVSHPGESLLDLLNERNLPAAWLAKQLGISRAYVSYLVNGIQGIGPGVALRLEALGLGNARFWLHRQADYDLWRARKESSHKRGRRSRVGRRPR